MKMKFTQQTTQPTKFFSFNLSSIRKYKFRASKLICYSFNSSAKTLIFSFQVKFRFPSRGTREDFLHNGTFHEAVGFVMAFAQIFGIMPVSGLRAPSAKHLKFKKCSFRFWLSIFYISTTAWVLGMQIYWIFDSKIEFGKLISVFFDLTNWLSVICFLELATKWPKLMQLWHEVEKILPKLETELKRQKMANEIRIVSFTVLFGSLGLKQQQNPQLSNFLS